MSHTDTNRRITTARPTTPSPGLVRATHDPRHEVVDWDRRVTANRPPR